jgi:RNA polymerase sigma-70 factor (ECF subfamily)
MLGSFEDAEDLVQETMLRAWRARDRYDERKASPRTWLHRIAANACRDALRARQRRPLPTTLVEPAADVTTPLTPDLDVPWLRPIPTARLTDDPADPAVRLVERGQLRLALSAALQLLPARQRAVVVLREVLEFSAAEVAEMLDATPQAVNSALQRARRRLGEAPAVDGPSSDEVDALVDRYVDAFERADVRALVALLTADAVLEMPPVPLWFRGRDLYGGFMSLVFERRGADWRVERTSANGQPALLASVRVDGAYVLHTVQVLTVGRGGIARNTVFQLPDVLDAFGGPGSSR